MSNCISSIIPDPEVLLSLEPEELAGVVIQHLNSIVDADHRNLNRRIFCAELGVQGYPQGNQKAIGEALMEAWIWLEHEGLLAPDPQSSEGWYFITRRGKRMRDANDLGIYRRANLLPKTLLHPIIAHKVWSIFIRGEYDTAIFQSFKEVEIAVRSAGDFDSTDIGTDLMRNAFNVSTGPLRDPNLPIAEREAMGHLLAGAIGLYKNPRSHRNVSITDPTEAVALIVLASHLMHIVDSRSKP